MEQAYLTAEAKAYLAHDPGGELHMVGGHPVVTVGAPIGDGLLAEQVAEMLARAGAGPAGAGRLAA